MTERTVTSDVVVQTCKHGIRLPHECRECREVVNPPGCICAYAHGSDPNCVYRFGVPTRFGWEQASDAYETGYVP